MTEQEREQSRREFRKAIHKFNSEVENARMRRTEAIVKTQSFRSSDRKSLVEDIIDAIAYADNEYCEARNLALKEYEKAMHKFSKLASRPPMPNVSRPPVPHYSRPVDDPPSVYPTLTPPPPPYLPPVR